MLCEKYQVNGQTAWSLLKKAERYNIQIVSSLDETPTRKMRLNAVTSLGEAVSELDLDEPGYILPVGAKFSVKNGS